MILCLGCSSKAEHTELLEQPAADSMRYQRADGYIPQDKIASSITLELSNDYPVWKPGIPDSSVHYILRNTGSNFLAAHGDARLFIYDKTRHEALYWSSIDLAHATSASAQMHSVISLPIGSSQNTIIPLLAVRWAEVSVKTWPSELIYAVVPPGDYLMRLEIVLVDEKSESYGTVVSNFVEGRIEK